MAFFQNNTDEFASLLDCDYDGQWTNVSISELTTSEQQVIKAFHQAATSNSGVVIEPEVLLVQAESGILKQVYAASLRQSEDGLAVKLGANLYPAQIEESERKVGTRTVKEYVILCGDLFGAVEFADKESEAEIKVENTLTKITYTRCWVDFTVGGDEVWRVPLTLDLTQKPTKQSVLASLADGTLASLLKPASGGNGGNGKAKGMQELGEGLFTVIGIRRVPTGNLIDIDGFGEVWSRGGADKQLNNSEFSGKADSALPDGRLRLKVANIQVKQTKEGAKTYLDSALRIVPVEGDVAVAAVKAEPKPVAATVPSFDDVPF